MLHRCGQRKVVKACGDNPLRHGTGFKCEDINTRSFHDRRVGQERRPVSSVCVLPTVISRRPTVISRREHAVHEYDGGPVFRLAKPFAVHESSTGYFVRSKCAPFVHYDWPCAARRLCSRSGPVRRGDSRRCKPLMSELVSCPRSCCSAICLSFTAI